MSGTINFCIFTHRKRKFYSAPIIKVNKNEYKNSPKIFKSHAGSCGHNIQIILYLGEAYGLLEMPGMNESVLVFSQLPMQFIHCSVLPLKIMGGREFCWTWKTETG